MVNPQQIQQLMGLLQSSGDPIGMLQQMAGNNPAMGQAINMIQSGGNPRTIAENLAKERGISPEQLRQMAGQFGIQL